MTQYGDLDQIYDESVGSADRMSSYPGTWCVDKDMPDGKQKRDSDNPVEKNVTKAAFRLSGYPPFDPNSVEIALLRVDVLYEPYEESQHPHMDEEISFRRQETCQEFGTIQYTRGLRDALRAASQDRRQWISLTLDLVAGTLQAQEIDDKGNPIPDRLYLGLEARDDLPEGHAHRLSYQDSNRDAVLQEASDGALEGLVGWSGKFSFASLIIKARGPATVLVIPPVEATVRAGKTSRNGWHHLNEQRDLSWAISPEAIGDAHVVEFDLVYELPGSVRAIAFDRQRSSLPASLRFVGAAPGSAIGRYAISLKEPGEEVYTLIDSGVLSTGGRDPTRRVLTIPHLHRVIDQDGKLRIRYRHENSIKQLIGEVGDAATRLFPKLVPTNEIDMMRLTVEVPQ